MTTTFPETRLANITAVIGDGTHGSYERVTFGVPLLSAKNILDGRLVTDDSESLVSESDAEEIEATCPVQPGDVLITTVGSLGRVTVFEPSERVVFQRSVAYVRPTSAIEARYLQWALRGSRVQSEIALRARQSAQAGIYLGDLAGLPIPVPTLAEQRRIANFLDHQVARVEAAREARLRQLACIRELGDALRSDILNSIEAPRLPLLWHLAQTPSYGVLKPEQYEGPGSVPLLRIFNLSQDGSFDVSDLMRISPDQHAEFRRTAVSAGDVLISVVGTIGRVTVADERLSGANLSRALARLVPKRQETALLIAAWLRSRAFRSFVQLTTQGTAQAVLNMSDLVHFRLALPSEPSQNQQACRSIAALERELGAAVSVLERSIVLLDELKFSLISAAVSGELDVSTAAGRGNHS